MTKKTNKVNEGFLDALVGDTGAAGLQSMFKKGMTGQEQLAQNNFIKTFVAKASSALEMAIKSGLVNPGIAPGPQPTATTSAAIPTTSPTQVPPAQQTGQRMNPQQTAIARNQTRAGIQPTGQPMTAAQRTQAQLQARKMQAAQKPRPVVTRENANYNKLNALFESILEQVAGQTIQTYLINYFTRYMGRVPYDKNLAQQIVNNVAATYSKDRGVKALTQLAQLAFASQVAGSAPDPDQEQEK